MSQDIETELGAVELRSGRRLAFVHVEHTEHDAHGFHLVSEQSGKRYVIRVPRSAVGALRSALDAFEARVGGT